MVKLRKLGETKDVKSAISIQRKIDLDIWQQHEIDMKLTAEVWMSLKYYHPLMNIHEALTGQVCEAGCGVITDLAGNLTWFSTDTDVFVIKAGSLRKQETG